MSTKTQFELLEYTDTIEEEKSTKHSALAKRLEEAIQDPLKVNVKLKVILEHRSSAQ